CLEEHLQRFLSSASQAFMKIPFTAEVIRRAVIETSHANGLKSGIVKCYAYHPDIDVGPATPETTTVAVFCLDFSALGIPHDKYAHPIRLGVSSLRKLHPQTAAVHAKITGNYANGFLARMEARGRGYDEALMLDLDGFVAEAPTANIFLASSGVVVTPPDECVLPGITRKVVMDVLGDMGVQVRKQPIRVEDLGSFDEGFLSGTLRHVQPLAQIEDCVFACPGPITASLLDRMQEVYEGTAERYRHLLTYLS
ncbi:MAG TPA: aminotransferase class IV, partial [Deltaproteobacteria bacterium]|nr:aminotransferase class IV [Deltaproteobacteria bacterium]